MKLRHELTLIHIFLLSFGSVYPLGQTPYVSGGPLSVYQSRYDVLYYDLNLRIDPSSRSLGGYVEVMIKSVVPALKVVELDLIDRYVVEDIVSNEKSLIFTHNNQKLLIDLPAPLPMDSITTLRIAYHGEPPVAKRPPWDGGFNWSTDSKGTPWIGVSCQEQGAKIWWPCKDHPSDEPDSVAINITIPDTLVCASNGLLSGVTDAEKGWRTWHWKTRYPINNYGVTVNIADYIVKRRPYKGKMEILFYVLETDTAGAAELLLQAENMLKFYATHFGEYPFIKEKFGLAQTDYYGMEHQTINSYGNHYRKTKLGYDFLMLHEMGHEWWGNYLTADDWADFWIHEGLDIYAEGMFIEDNYGRDEYLRFFREKARSRIENKKPLVPGRNATTAEAYGIDIYYKGAYVAHMLRYLMGRDALYALLRDFVQTPKKRPQNHVVTADFITLVSQRTGKDLGWFFNRYLFQAKLPVLKSTVKHKSKRTDLKISWETKDFYMPVEVLVKTGEKEWRERIPVTPEEKIFHYPPGSKVEIDPDGWILYEPARKGFFGKKRIQYVLGLLGLLGIIQLL
ncbi:MAG: M1 family metallopeptidase [FCB group bacterium]|nr:M1 family metallopeptidase [FCB group bacterium]